MHVNAGSAALLEHTASLKKVCPCVSCSYLGRNAVPNNLSNEFKLLFYTRLVMSALVDLAGQLQTQDFDDIPIM